VNNGHDREVLVSGVRTAVGKYGGSLKDIPPTTRGSLGRPELAC
jgi:hypothetical protein